jgi:hypothetical protein
MPSLSQIGKEMWEVRLEMYLQPLVKSVTLPIFTKLKLGAHLDVKIAVPDFMNVQ